MATLTNQQINLTYPGLIKTTDNLGVDPTVLKQLTDGVGGSIPISVSQAQTKFASGSSVDFTGSTVTGIDAAGLVAGSGPDSMQSVSSLTPNPAAATGTSSIALGNASTASNTSSVAIGSSVTASKNGAVCIGDNGQAAGTDGCVRLGQNNNVTGDGLVAIGSGGTVSGNLSIGIGYNAAVTGGGSITIQSTGFDFGTISGAGVLHLVPGGYSTNVSAADTIVLGSCVDNRQRVGAANAIAIGKNTQASFTDSVAIGSGSSTTANQAVALGAGIQATRVNVVSVNELECKAVGGGVIFISPNGTAYRQSISDTGVPVYTLA